MRAVFVHDHKFRLIDGRFYSPGGLPNDVLSRYAEWFDNIIVIGRVIHEQYAKTNYSQIENPNVRIETGENLKEIIRKAECVIVRLPSINGYKAIRYAKKYKKPYLVEVVGCTFDAYWNYGVVGRLLSIPAFLIMRYCVRNSPFTVYVTSSFLQKRYPSYGKTISVSDVAIDSLDEEIITNRLDRINADKKRIILGTAGAVDVEYKGQEFVIRALPYLKNEMEYDIHYELAGAGDNSRLRKVAEELNVLDNVVFKGSIKHEEMNSWYDSIDIYVQPSLLEGLSRAVIEAMSRGLPCVVANKGGNPELIEKQFLFSTKKKNKIPVLLSECIKKVVPLDQRQKVSIRNYRIAKKYYNRKELDVKRDSFYCSFKEYCMSGESS